LLVCDTSFGDKWLTLDSADVEYFGSFIYNFRFAEGGNILDKLAL